MLPVKIISLYFHGFIIRKINILSVCESNQDCTVPVMSLLGIFSRNLPLSLHLFSKSWDSWVFKYIILCYNSFESRFTSGVKDDPVHSKYFSTVIWSYYYYYCILLILGSILTCLVSGIQRLFFSVIVVQHEAHQFVITKLIPCVCGVHDALPLTSCWFSWLAGTFSISRPDI